MKTYIFPLILLMLPFSSHIYGESDKRPSMHGHTGYPAPYREKDRTLDSTLAAIDQAIERTDAARHPHERARLDIQKAAALLKSACYSEAYQLYSDAAKTFHETDDYRMEAYCLNRIGYIFFFLNEYGDATVSLKRADSIYSALKLEREGAECRLLLANIHNNTGKRQEALGLLRPIVENRREDETPEQRISALSAYLSCLEDETEVRKYSEEAYELARQTNDPYYLIITILNKGWSMYHSGHTDSACAYARQAAMCAEQNHMSYGRKEGIYRLFASAYEARQQWDSAYHYQSLYHTCLDSVRGKDVLTNIHRMEIKKRTEEQRMQFILEKQRNRQKLAFFLTVGTALLVLLAVSVYIICLLRKRMEQEQRKRMEKDQEYIRNLSREKERVEAKNRELSSNAVLLMKKNDVLKDMLKDIENMHGNKQADTHELQQKIQLELKSDDLWKAFKMHFNAVHPLFFSLLKEKHPKLTDNELRLCAYVRMGLNNKEIAGMLSVQPKAILQARYRLKKKMGLADETNLNDHLMAIVTPHDPPVRTTTETKAD